MRLVSIPVKVVNGMGIRGNRLPIPVLVALGILTILFLDQVFSPALVNLVESVAGKFAPMEVVLRAHFLVIFFQVLLVGFYLLFISPTRDFRKRVLLYFVMVESLVLCSIWIFDRSNHRFLSEESALTFFSSLFLILCALTALLNSIYLKFQTKSTKSARLFWYLMTLAFLFAGIDEFFMIHENVSKFIHDANWINDFVTALYAIGACIVVVIFYFSSKIDVFTKNGYFFKLMIGGIACLTFAVFLDTFDFLFRFMNKYFRMFDLLNSLEELMEFTAATLFLCAFVMNLFEADDHSFLKLIESKIPRHETKYFVKVSYLAFVLFSIVFFFGIKIAYKVEEEPIILESGYKASVFADISDGLNTPDGLIYDRELGLFVGNGGKVNNILVFDKDGQGRVFADPTTGLVSPEALVVWNKALYVSDDSGGKILKYDAAGAAPTVVAEKGLKSPDALALDSQGNIYIGDERLSLLIKQTGERREVLASALDGLKTPEEIAIDDRDNLYVTDEGARAVFKISASGETTIFADKSDGLVSPEGMTFHAGKLYVTDSEAGIIYRYDQDGTGGKFLSFAKKYRRLSGIAFDDQDALYVVSGDHYSSRGHIFRIELKE